MVLHKKDVEFRHAKGSLNLHWTFSADLIKQKQVRFPELWNKETRALWVNYPGARQKLTSKIQSLPVAFVLKEPGCCLQMTKGKTGSPRIDWFGISEIWQHSSWMKQWNSFTLQLISGKQQLTAPFGARSWQAEVPGRGTACEPCQQTPARHRAAARLATEAPAAVTQAGKGAQILPSPQSCLFLECQTYWQFCSALKGGSMCLKLPLTHTPFRDF